MMMRMFYNENLDNLYYNVQRVCVCVSSLFQKIKDKKDQR